MKKNLNKGKGMDERQKQINNKAMSVSWLFLTACVLFQLVYKMLHDASWFWELIILYAAFGIVALVRRLMGDIQCPRGITNKPLPTGNTKDDKRKRHIDYLLEAILFSGIFTLMLVPVFAFSSTSNDTLVIQIFSFGGTYNAVSVVVVCAIAFFIVAAAVGYLSCFLVKEEEIKKYNQMCAELENETAEE
jgi:hypothetical protein